MDDETWLNLYAEYKYTEQIRYDNNVAASEEALVKIINSLFSSDGQK